jgi:hypothetical protein
MEWGMPFSLTWPGQSVPRTLMLINGARVESARAEFQHGGILGNFLLAYSQIVITGHHQM